MFLKSGFHTSIVNSHLICQWPLSNLQDLVQSYFPFRNAGFLNSWSTCSPKPRRKLVRRPPCSSALCSPILLRTSCCSVDLDGILTDSVLLSVFIVFLIQTSWTPPSESIVITSLAHFCSYHFLQNTVQTSPNSTPSSAPFFCPSFDHPLTSPTDLGFLLNHSSSTTFLTYLLCFSFSLSFLILFSLKTQCNYYPTWKTFWFSACLAFLSLPVISVFPASYN